MDEMPDAPNLRDVPYVDGHMHPPLAEPEPVGASIRAHWFEGAREFAGLADSLAAFRWSMGALSAWLDCDPTIGAIAEALEGQTIEERSAAAVRGGAVAGLVVDTGYPRPGQAMGAAKLAKATGVVVASLLRIEALAESLLPNCDTFDAFSGRYADSLETARQGGYTGLKSIIAYRSGLQVASEDPAAAAEAFDRMKQNGKCRLEAKALLDWLFWRAVDAAAQTRMPLQLHCGYGDPDIRLERGNPLLLQPVIEDARARDVDFVVLHGAFPYTKEAAWLAATHHNVYLDISVCIPPVGLLGVVDMWHTALSVAPWERLQVSSDANGLPEQIYLGGIAARQTLGIALGHLKTVHAVTATDIDRIAEAVLAKNALRIYWGKTGEN